MKELTVAVAVLRRGDGCVLVAHRDVARHQGGRLEFPGGKVERGERAEAALGRELAEELGVTPRSAEPLLSVRHVYTDRAVRLETFLVEQWDGEAHGAEGQMIEWRHPEELRGEWFPAANRPIVAALQLPSYCLITPASDDRTGAGRQRLLQGLRRTLARAPHPLLVQLRWPGLPEAEWPGLIEAAAEIVRGAPGCRLVVNADPDIVERSGADVGIHLTSERAASMTSRPVPPGRLLCCACHDAGELSHAERIGVDFAVLGSVMPSATHPGAPTLGWRHFGELVAGTTLPVYALGGLAPGDLSRARAFGAVGVAGIRGFWHRAP